MLHALLTLSTLLPLQATPPDPGFRWDSRNAEHLLNRAGFGARTAEVDAAVAAGFAATLDRIVDAPADWEMPAYERIDEPTKKELEGLSKEEQDKRKRDAREADRRQMLEIGAWWFREMETSGAPLLEKMTLFWHGFFTTSIEEAKRSHLVLQQHEFLRRNALGSYADLLRGIARDPAMLVYLDNDVNRKGSPNENFARELMELYSLGEGNYTEADVKDAARALTGRGVAKDGSFELRSKQHDDGEKTVLGVTGRLDGDRLIEIILAQDACPRQVARRLMTWFEGVDPEPARLAEYAHFLREQEFGIRPFLRKLFSDPRFYRDEIVGARVLGPVEFMVGTARRARVEAPPGLLGAGAALLGQRLFSPPTVKGWDEGYAWITTSTLMQRGNLAGLMLGVVKVADVVSLADVEAEMAAEAGGMRAGGMQAGPQQGGTGQAGTGQRGAEQTGSAPSGAMPGDSAPGATSGRGDAPGPVRGDEPGMQPGATAPTGAKPDAKPPLPPKPKVPRSGPAMDVLRRIESAGWYPALNLRVRLEKAGARTDAQIVDRMLEDLLAIAAPADTRARFCAFLAAERQARKIQDGKLLDAGGDAERILRRMAHLILSLPEAQLG